MQVFVNVVVSVQYQVCPAARQSISPHYEFLFLLLLPCVCSAAPHQYLFASGWYVSTGGKR